MNSKDFFRVKYFIYCLFHRDGYSHAEYLKKYSVFHSIGDNCYFRPYDCPADAKSIRFGNNVRIASHVSFICHDLINQMLNFSGEFGKDFKPFYGKIEVGNNVYIGSYTVVLANVKIGSNVIIAAGSLVNRDIPDGKIAAGVPAKVVGNTSDFVEKRRKWNESEIALAKNEKERLRLLWKD